VIVMGVAKTIAVTFGMLGVIYIAWFLYAIYVLEPNENNNTVIGVVMASLMALLAVSTIAMSRSVWLRSSGRPTSTRQFWVYTPFMVIFSALVSGYSPSPTTLIFVIFAIVLLFLNLALGRSRVPSYTR